MTNRDRLLYHHAHPAKLAVDLAAAGAATWLFWDQHPLRGMAAGLIPPAAVSLVVLQFADLERVRRSMPGRYVGRNMSLALHTTSVAGVFILWAAAWYRSIFYCSVGLLITAFAWVRGRLIQ